MSTVSVYFIPVKDFPVEQFSEKVKKALEKLNFIEGYYDEEDNTYASGELMAFEYASIHDTDKRKLVPEASSEGYGAVCVQCNTDIDEQLYDTINDYYDAENETGEEKDMAVLNLVCNKCNKTMELHEVKFTYPAALANQFFQFVDIDDEISEEAIAQIEKELGTKFTVIYESM